jgi:hypothetical protein
MAPVEQQTIATELADRLVALSSQWPKIVEYSGLPSAAQNEIVWAIARYRAGMRTLNPTASAMRDDIGKLAQKAKTLAEGLAQLPMTPRVAVYLTLGMASKEEFVPTLSENRARNRLREECTRVRDLATWLTSAHRAVVVGKRGGRERSLLVTLLVKELDDIRLRHTGRRIIRSRKRDTSREYITAVCSIADPKIGPGAIEEAMKTVIAGRSRKSKPK